MSSGRVPLRPAQGPHKSYRGGRQGPPVTNCEPAWSRRLFLSTGNSPLPPEPALRSGTGQKGRRRTCPSESSFPHLPPQEPESRGTPRASRGHLPLPLHLALASLPRGGQTSRSPSLLLQRLRGPDKSHALTGAQPQRPGCLLSVGFVFAVTVVPPRETTAWAPGTSEPHPRGGRAQAPHSALTSGSPPESQASRGRKGGHRQAADPRPPDSGPAHGCSRGLAAVLSRGAAGDSELWAKWLVPVRPAAPRPQPRPVAGLPGSWTEGVSAGRAWVSPGRGRLEQQTLSSPRARDGGSEIEGCARLAAASSPRGFP